MTRSAKIYNFVGYGVTEDGDIDYAELERLAKEHHPQLIFGRVFGFHEGARF